MRETDVQERKYLGPIEEVTELPWEYSKEYEEHLDLWLDANQISYADYQQGF